MKNELPIKYYQDLLTSKGRKEHNSFIVEGVRQVEQFVKSEKMKILEILTTDDVGINHHLSDWAKNVSPLQNTNTPVRHINFKQLNKITDSKTPNGVIAVVEIPKNELNYIDSKVLVLEDVQDPGNVGTILRTAAAFGFKTVILSENCADIYSPKVVRSTGGALCNLNVIQKANIYEKIQELKAQNYSLIIADLNGEKDISKVKNEEKIILALGNEGNGISDKLRKMADFVLTIPFDSSAIESLNVSIAGSILMFQLQNSK